MNRKYLEDAVVTLVLTFILLITYSCTHKSVQPTDNQIDTSSMLEGGDINKADSDVIKERSATVLDTITYCKDTIYLDSNGVVTISSKAKRKIWIEKSYQTPYHDPKKPLIIFYDSTKQP